jgi:hypothetical protein
MPCSLLINFILRSHHRSFYCLHAYANCLISHPINMVSDLLHFVRRAVAGKNTTTSRYRLVVLLSFHNRNTPNSALSRDVLTRWQIGALAFAHSQQLATRQHVKNPFLHVSQVAQGPRDNTPHNNAQFDAFGSDKTVNVITIFIVLSLARRKNSSLKLMHLNNTAFARRC